MESLRHPFSDLAWNVSEPEYRADPALSYSTLSKYEKEGRFRAIPLLGESISTPSLVFGSVVDALVTGGYGEFNDLFVVADLPQLSENLENIARVLHERYGKDRLFDDILDDELAAVGKECDFYANDKYTAYRSKLIRENCREYYNVLSSATGKTLITQKDYNDALACKEAFLNSQFTSGYFQEMEDVDTFYQLKFKGEDPETHILYRCMADILKVSHSNKTIYPIDVKTSSKPEEEFPKSYIQWNYNIQSRNYWRLIRQAMNKDSYYKNFTLANYTFLVVNRNTLTPLAWSDSMTQAIGDVVYKTNSGRTIIVRDPYVIGKEITYYRANTPVYPMGVRYNNSITQYIQNEM